jgi:F5/8 type C domain
MSVQKPWLLLALFGLSSCLVPGLELGPEASDAGGSAPGGAGGFPSGGTRFTSNQPLGVGLAAAGGEVGSASEAGSGGAPGSGDVAGFGGVAGLGGAAGGEAVVRCDEHPIPPKSAWSVIASSSSLGTGTETDPLYNPPSHVIDGMLDERWASGQPQEDGQWFHIDFGVDVALSHVVLQQGKDIDDYPRGYAISVSNRHTDFDAAARATGHGASVSEEVIPLDHPVVGRYMLIRQTGSAKVWWSIAEISVECH